MLPFHLTRWRAKLSSYSIVIIWIVKYLNIYYIIEISNILSKYLVYNKVQRTVLPYRVILDCLIFSIFNLILSVFDCNIKLHLLYLWELDYNSQYVRKLYNHILIIITTWVSGLPTGFCLYKSTNPPGFAFTNLLNTQLLQILFTCVPALIWKLHIVRNLCVCFMKWTNKVTKINKCAKSVNRIWNYSTWLRNI